MEKVNTHKFTHCKTNRINPSDRELFFNIERHNYGEFSWNTHWIGHPENEFLNPNKYPNYLTIPLNVNLIKIQLIDTVLDKADRESYFCNDSIITIVDKNGKGFCQKLLKTIDYFSESASYSLPDGNNIFDLNEHTLKIIVPKLSKIELTSFINLKQKT